MQWALFLFTGLLLSACGNTTNDEAINPPVIASIAATPSQVFLANIGDSVIVQTEARDNYNQPLSHQPSFSWSSDDETIATVNTSGLVTAVGLGQTTVTVTAGDVITIIPVTIDTSIYSLSGRVTYQDKLYSEGPVSDGPYKSVRFALVDLVDNTSGSILESVTTDSIGNYSFSPFSVGDYYVRVLTQTDPATGHDIRIKDLEGNIYASTSTVSLLTTSITQDIELSTASPIAGSFNMLDVFTAASEYLQAISSGTQVMDPLNVFWSSTNYFYGSYTCSGSDSSWCIRGPGIYVLGGDASVGDDTDEYDDDVLWHEYAHFLEHNLNHLDSPGGQHLLTDNTLDLRLAWSEGLGDYLSGAIKTWLRSNNPNILSIPPLQATSIYIDTAGTSPAIAFDFAAPETEFNPSSYFYASNEAAVAKTLFGLTSGGSNTQDLWYSLSSHLPFTSDWINMESFWDGWLLSTASANLLGDQATLAERNIYYQEDSKEPDNSIAEVSASPIDCTPDGECYNQEHYLYRDTATDGDFIAINVSAGKSYTIYTQNLRNGADTLINLRDTLNNVRATNDDQFAPNCCVNNGTNLRSSIAYLAPTTETLYIEVITSTDMADWAGRYGTYTLTVSATTP